MITPMGLWWIEINHRVYMSSAFTKHLHTYSFLDWTLDLVKPLTDVCDSDFLSFARIARSSGSMRRVSTIPPPPTSFDCAAPAGSLLFLSDEDVADESPEDSSCDGPVASSPSSEPMPFTLPLDGWSSAVSCFRCSSVRISGTTVTANDALSDNESTL